MQDNVTSKIRFIKKKPVNHVVENIVHNLAEIDIIKYVTISKDYIKASSEITTGRIKIPITKPDHPSAVGISLILDIDHNDIQFYEINSSIKGYGSKMVDAVMRALPEDWSAIVVMDWSHGFWEKMLAKYNKLVIL